jgi:hypothetical protein
MGIMTHQASLDWGAGLDVSQSVLVQYRMDKTWPFGARNCHRELATKELKAYCIVFDPFDLKILLGNFNLT